MRLSVEQLSVELAGQRIVKDVRLGVAAGELVGLIGPNGSGKSTLLRSVYRMLRPSSGRVLLGSDDVWQLSARSAAQRTGVVVQEHSSEFDFSVREMVALGRNPHKGSFSRDTPDDVRIISRALERVSMGGFADRTFATLSGGEKQRVLLARALAQEPKVLVLDEPTNHLDIHHQLELLELLKTLNLTTLVTLHDLNLAAAYCERLYLLEGGLVVADGSPAEVLTPERLRRVFHIGAVCGAHPLTGRLHLSFVPLKEATRVDETALQPAAPRRNVVNTPETQNERRHKNG